MKKIWSLLVISALTLISCTKDKKQTNLDNEVKVGYLNMVSSLTHFVALEKGYYEEQGVKVVANQVKTSNQIAQELTAGHIDVGIELAITPVLKHLDSAPDAIKIFSTSTITVDNGFDAVVVNKDSEIKEIKDLAGKKIGGFPGTTAKVSFLQLFKSKFPDATPPTFLALTPNLHIQSLLTGDVDALFAYEPVLSTGVVEHGFKKIFPSVYGSQFSPNPIGVGALNAKWFNTNPKQAKAFLKAIDKALDFIQNNPKEAKEILAKSTNIKVETAQNMNTLPLSKSDNIDLKSLDEYLALLVDLKEITTQPKAINICIKQK